MLGVGARHLDGDDLPARPLVEQRDELAVHVSGFRAGPRAERVLDLLAVLMRESPARGVGAGCEARARSCSELTRTPRPRGSRKSGLAKLLALGELMKRLDNWRQRRRHVKPGGKATPSGVRLVGHQLPFTPAALNGDRARGAPAGLKPEGSLDRPAAAGWAGGQRPNGRYNRIAARHVLRRRGIGDLAPTAS